MISVNANSQKCKKMQNDLNMTQQFKKRNAWTCEKENTDVCIIFGEQSLRLVLWILEGYGAARGTAAAPYPGGELPHLAYVATECAMHGRILPYYGYNMAHICDRPNRDPPTTVIWSKNEAFVLGFVWYFLVCFCFFCLLFVKMAY